MKTRIDTAVFPVAGMGTRFLPVTKAGPKEMLPVVDKPLIQYVVEEALEAGITQLIFVTSNTKRSIEDYFDSNFELEYFLAERHKEEELDLVRNILPAGVQCVYVRQPRPLGLGDAVWRVKEVVGDRPFAVLLADDIIDAHPKACLKSMVEIFEATQQSVLAVEAIDPIDSRKYGMVEPADEKTLSAFQIKNIVEKPAPELAPSRFAVAGRYILTPAIFNCLEKIELGIGHELQLTDAIARLLQKESVYAFPFKGKRYDCGHKIGLIEATIAFALRRPELKDQLKKLLLDHLQESENVV